MPAVAAARYPWTDRAGRLSLLKAVVFASLFAPAVWIAFEAYAGLLGPRPLNAAMHETGSWAVRFLVASLVVTPFRRILDWPKLILVRRMLGLAGLAYALLHLVLYMADESWVLTKVASEIVLRFYLTIGFVALLGLIALGATSTDAAIRRLGPAWNRLHRLAYPIVVLALVHHFLQAKVDVSQPALMTGLFLLLMTYRAMHARGIALSPLPLALAALAMGPVTALVEYAWYEFATGLPAWRVAAANLHPEIMLRPAWWVAIVGLAVALAALLRRLPPLASLGRRAASGRA